MAKFNGDYKNEYAMQLMGEYFRNSLTYFRGEVRDSSYFRPLLRMADERAIEQAIYDFFGGEDLVKCDVACFCEKEGRDPRNGRKYGHPEMFYHRDDPEDTIMLLWNDKEHRERCRKLLIGIVDGFIADRTKAVEGDVLKSRFDELRRFFKFTDLEMDAIKYAFVRSSTAFECASTLESVALWHGECGGAVGEGKSISRGWRCGILGVEM